MAYLCAEQGVECRLGLEISGQKLRTITTNVHTIVHAFDHRTLELWCGHGRRETYDIRMILVCLTHTLGFPPKSLVQSLHS